MQEAHSRERFRVGCPVTLSEEGRDKLRPFRPLAGYVAGVSDGLVTVLEAPERTANYHPDFLDYDPSRGRARRLSRQQMCAACRRTITTEEFAISTRQGIMHQFCGAAE